MRIWYLTLSSLTSHYHLHPPQTANRCRNSGRVVDEDDLTWFNPCSAELFFCKNHRDQRFFYLALSDSFEYLCYGSTVITNIFTLTVLGWTLVVRIRRPKTSDSDDFILIVRIRRLKTSDSDD